MTTAFYFTSFAISVILFILFWLGWRKNYSILYTITFTIITIVNMGYLMLSLSEDLREAILAQKIIYIGGCFLLMMVMFYVAEMCHIGFPKAVKGFFTLINAVFYIGVLTIGFKPYFYADVIFHNENGDVWLEKSYAPLHTVFYIFKILEFLISFAILIYALRYKNKASRKSMKLLFFAEAISFFAFFFGRIVTIKFELLPMTYAIDEIIFLIIASRTSLYDVNNVAGDSLAEQGDIGLALFDFDMCYLGCNEAALMFVPAFEDQHVDAMLRGDDKFIRYIKEWLIYFRDDVKGDDAHIIKNNDKYISFDVDYLYEDRRKRGYRLMITDVTEQQEYVNLINYYNMNLQKEVENKTAHIQALQDSLVVGMATMVESRDNSTGGHIKRTSDVVKILMDEIMKDNVFGIDEVFRKNMIKAAPMHDLGKIAVDDDVLKKPGRFTPEEFNEMKKHAAEGAKVVAKILADTDDEDFKKLAVNVAHYHHERWDGSGYPKGLKGDDIPLEARIMAIADVYDALVSKRCYKDSMSYEKADSIIMESMGTHFDERLKPYYVKARTKIERYYDTQDKG